MKIAVFADVHSNLDALETVLDHIDLWRPDRILCAGDIINRGPHPRTCTERVLDRAKAEDWGVIRGNHERYVLNYGDGNWPDGGPEYDIQRHAKWTYDQLDGLVEPLAALPVQWDMQDDFGNELRMVHASMLGDRRGIFPDDADEALREKIARRRPCWWWDTRTGPWSGPWTTPSWSMWARWARPSTAIHGRGMPG